ncbi:hypothetical protein VTN77DRAFT_644 [Rasamsonia byssochlamydoides]|uniref:uncharacterized protein n=1 Tax=Rasamsonia byssochlamydoides TaxID=89139 RepID=UPI0037440229
MSATPNVIVLESSSPDCIWARSISPCTPERLFGFSPRSSSPPSMMSPSKLFGTTSSSRRHDASATGKSPLREEVGRENIQVVNTQQESEVGGKAKRAPRNGQAKQQKMTGETEPVSKDPQSKTAKRTTGTTRRVRSQKAKKSEETGNKILKGRVAKPDSGNARDAVEKTVASENMQLDLPGDGARKPSIVEEAGLNLEEAMKRRLDWTPPKDTECQVIDLDGDDAAGRKDTDGSRGFGDLLLDYRFDDESSTSRDHVQQIGDGQPTKRRRIELVEFQVPKFDNRPRASKEVLAVDSVDVSGAKHRNEKPRSQRKQMKTITAHATARYIPLDEEEDGTLLRYFERNEGQTTDKTKAPKRKVPAKRGNNSVVKSKALWREHIILSPEAATKSLEDQELLFGTWSQLEGDDSPTFVRETQKALLASESFVSTESSNLSGQSATSSSTRSTLSRFTSSRGLWSVAARNSEGFVVQPEILDMVNSPDASSGRQTPSLQANADRIDDARETQKDELLVVGTNSNVQSKPASTCQQKQQEQPVSRRESSVPLEPAKPVNNREVTVAAKEPSLPPPEMPRYSGFTDAELSKQIAAYGFKPIKSRNKMIALLEKCWQNMHPTAGQAGGNSESSQFGLKQTKDKPQPSDFTKSADKTTVTVGSQAKTSSRQANKEEQQQQPDKPKSRGRRRKGQTASLSSSSLSSVSGRSKGKKKAAPETETENTKATTPAAVVVEEIEDSEEEIIPSPTRIQQQQLQQSRYFSTNSSRRRRPTTPTIPPLPLASRPAASPSSTPQRSTASTSTTIPDTNHGSGDNNDDNDTLPSLFSQITKAVQAQPRMPGQKRQPTWHEKILLYDPIVLEELATWLNTEGLGLIGEDREVSAGLVREWCERKGVCCCYRK